MVRRAWPRNQSDQPGGGSLVAGTHIQRHQPGVLASPIVVRRLADPSLATDLAGPGANPASLSTKDICASEDLDLLIVHSVSWPAGHNWNSPAWNGPGFRRQMMTVKSDS